MSRYLDPKADVVFKKIFGDHPNLLISFLNALLPLPIHSPIQSPDEKKLRLLWLRFLREVDEKTTTVSNDLLAIPEIAQALELAEESAYTPGELTLYESYWDQVSREKTLIMDKYAEGKAEGKVEGKIEEKYEIAKNLLERSVAIEIVIAATGLTLEEIEKIKASINEVF